MRMFWMVFLSFLLLAGLVVVVEHRTHWFGPYGDYIWLLLVAACPLMHVLMHRKHGSHGDNADLQKREGGHRHG